MSSGWLVVLTAATAVGAAVSGGVLFGFSTFVMRSLDRLPPKEGMAAMQSINREAPNPLFMLALFGTALAGIVLAISALGRMDEKVAVYQLVGSLLYLVGVGVTLGYHIPHNNTLAALDPNRADAAGEWARFSSGWTAWNHVRTAAMVAAAATLTAALRVV